MTREVPEVYLFDGATEFAGPWGLLWALWHWRALRRAMKDTPGYLAHRLWYGFPYTIGLVTWWKDEAAAYRFLPQRLARQQHQRRPGHDPSARWTRSAADG